MNERRILSPSPPSLRALIATVGEQNGQRGGNSGGGGADGMWGGMGVWQHMVSCSEVSCPRWPTTGNDVLPTLRCLRVWCLPLKLVTTDRWPLPVNTATCSADALVMLRVA